MSFTKCLADLENVVELDFSEGEILDLRELYDSIKNKTGGNTQETYNIMLDGIKELKSMIAVKHRNAILDAKITDENFQYILDVWEDNPAEGLKAIFAESQAAREGSKAGLSAHVNATGAEFVQGLSSELHRLGLTDYIEAKSAWRASRGVNDEDIARAMYELTSGREGGKAWNELPNEAQQVAKVFDKYMSAARKRANDVGAHIGVLKGRIGPRSWDVFKVRNTPKDVWVNGRLERIDINKTFPGLDATAVRKELNMLYELFSEGQHVQFKGPHMELKVLKQIRSYGKDLSQHRKIFYKTFEDEWADHLLFSKETTMTAQVIFNLRRYSRDVAIMERLGPHSLRNTADLVGRLKQHYSRQDGGGKKIADLTKMEEFINNKMVPTLTDEIHNPVNHTAAKWGSFVRQVNAVTLLGKAVINSLGDIIFGAQHRTYAGDRTTGSFLGNVSTSMYHSITDMAKGTNNPDAQRMAARMGIMLETILPLPTKFEADIHVPGEVYAASQTMIRFTGLPRWQDGLRLGAVRVWGGEMARYMDTAFDNLEDGTRSYLKQHNILKDDWEIIRKHHKMDVDDQGNDWLSTESLREIPWQVFSDVEYKGKTAKRRLMHKYRNMAWHYANMVANEPTHIDRAHMLRGTRRGTFEGELFRMFSELKATIFSILRKHGGRELHGYHAETATLPQAIQRLYSDPRGGASGLMRMFVGSVVVGHMVTVLKDIASGRVPRDVTDPEQAGLALRDAMINGGFFGLYADIIMGTLTKEFGKTPTSWLAGPTFAKMDYVIDLWGRLLKGDVVAGQEAQRALNLIPGKNYTTKLATDYLIFNQLEEMLNPGIHGRRSDWSQNIDKQRRFGQGSLFQ